MADFFIGIRLPRQLEKECEAWRRTFKAPRTVAHITLIPPFVWERDEEELSVLALKSAGNQTPFKISGKGLGNFGKRVLFLPVELTPGLESLRRKFTETLLTAGIAVDKRPYRPHITLATRLKGEQFQQFRAQLADFRPDFAFLCSEVSLFRLSTERRWEEYQIVPLGGMQKQQEQ